MKQKFKIESLFNKHYKIAIEVTKNTLNNFNKLLSYFFKYVSLL